MKSRLVVGAMAVTVVAAGVAVLPTTAQAARPMVAAPPVVTLSMQGDQAVVSPATVRPGVVEFHIASTFKIPGKDGGPDTLSVVLTDNLPAILAALPAVFGGDPSDPVSLAAAAEGTRTIHGAGTAFGGGGKGTVWQVRLNPGVYTIVGFQSTAMGLAKPATLTVAGDPRPGVIHPTQAVVRPVGRVGANRWTFHQSGRPVEWLRFTNAAHELHFLDMTGVKPGTTDAQVRKALASPKDPTFFTGPSINFEVVSPGVSVAIMTPAPPGKYLLTCFIPSEADGMPHALMGMWKLVNVR